MKIRATKQDKAFSKYIRERDKKCRRCGATKFLQCAHIISRFYRRVRWNEDNAVCLCRSCHVFFTYRPIEWKRWVNATIGAWQYEKLEQMAVPEGPQGLQGPCGDRCVAG